ncbi:MAG: hypothetical protein K0R51_2441 [Cytophagaceae bacterium]|jgi:hypothetical protein|nr:hypothetical protein [Cytophagaceae bacterium]
MTKSVFFMPHRVVSLSRRAFSYNFIKLYVKRKKMDYIYTLFSRACKIRHTHV